MYVQTLNYVLKHASHAHLELTWEWVLDMLFSISIVLWSTLALATNLIYEIKL